MEVHSIRMFRTRFEAGGSPFGLLTPRLFGFSSAAEGGKGACIGFTSLQDADFHQEALWKTSTNRESARQRIQSRPVQGFTPDKFILEERQMLRDVSVRCVWNCLLQEGYGFHSATL